MREEWKLQSSMKLEFNNKLPNTKLHMFWERKGSCNLQWNLNLIKKNSLRGSWRFSGRRKEVTEQGNVVIYTGKITLRRWRKNRWKETEKIEDASERINKVTFGSLKSHVQVNNSQEFNAKDVRALVRKLNIDNSSGNEMVQNSNLLFS